MTLLQALLPHPRPQDGADQRGDPGPHSLLDLPPLRLAAHHLHHRRELPLQPGQADAVLLQGGPSSHLSTGIKMGGLEKYATPDRI